MSDSFVGQITLFAGDFAPRGWALCNGQSMSIAENSALFEVIRTTYGGDGNTTFNLPNLKNARPDSAGNAVNYIICIQGLFPQQ